MNIQERRYSPATIRGEASGQKKILSGLAARFNALSENLGGFRERLAPGCFADSLRSGRDVAMLLNHDTSKPLGRLSNKTLALRETVDGLAFQCQLDPEVTHARDLFQMCLRGDIKECSFGFTCDADTWADEADPDGRGRAVPVRTVRRANLFEISAVTFPAYANDATSVTASIVDSQALTVAAGAGRSLWPSGSIPAEIRSRVPSLALPLSPADEELFARGRVLIARCATDDCIR